jgi:hypothetical protein
MLPQATKRVRSHAHSGGALSCLLAYPGLTAWAKRAKTRAFASPGLPHEKHSHPSGYRKQGPVEDISVAESKINSPVKIFFYGDPEHVPRALMLSSEPA